MMNFVPCACGSTEIAIELYNDVGPERYFISCKKCERLACAYALDQAEDVWEGYIEREKAEIALMETVKPCECGSKNIENGSDDYGCWYVSCSDCDREVASNNLKGAVAKWNNTPTRDALKARIDELESELEAYKARPMRCDTCGRILGPNSMWCAEWREYMRPEQFCSEWEPQPAPGGEEGKG